MINNCLGVTAIGLGIAEVCLLSAIVAVSAVIGIEAVSIVMELHRVVGNQAIYKLSLKIEKHDWLCITGVGLLSTIVAASAVFGIEAVSIFMGLLRVVGKAITKLSFNIEKHEKIEMLAVSSFNTISNLISKIMR